MDVSVEKEDGWVKGLKKSCLSHRALGVGADISPLCQFPGKTRTVGCWFVGVVWPPILLE